MVEVTRYIVAPEVHQACSECERSDRTSKKIRVLDRNVCRLLQPLVGDIRRELDGQLENAPPPPRHSFSVSYKLRV